jgi:carbonic anhydrase
MEQSHILRDMILNGEIGIIGAVYNVETGVVTFHEDTLVIGREMFKEALEAVTA